MKKVLSDKYLSRDMREVRKLSTWITEGRAFQTMKQQVLRPWGRNISAPRKDSRRAWCAWSRTGGGGTEQMRPERQLQVPGIWVRSLAWEDSSCCRAAKPMWHNYWAHVLEPENHNDWICVLRLLKPTHLQPVLGSKRSLRKEKSVRHSEE